MKKNIFVLFFLMLFMVGCNPSNNTNKDNLIGENNLNSQEKESSDENSTDILDKYGNLIEPITILNEEIPFEYTKYLGEYEGYHVFLKYFASSWGDIKCFAFNEMIFCIHDTYSIVLYNKEGSISFQESIASGLLKAESVRNIYYYYCKYIVEESEQGYASTFTHFGLQNSGKL